MKFLMDPRSVLLTHLLPVILLFLFAYSQYTIIHSLIDEDNLAIAKKFAISLGSISLLHLVIAGLSYLRKKPLGILYGLLSIATVCFWIGAYFFLGRDMLPDVPRWMMPEEPVFFILMLLMPTLAQSVLVLANAISPNPESKSAWKSFLLSALVPCFWFLVSRFPYSFREPEFMRHRFFEHLMVVVVIASFVLFFVLLARGFLILFSRGSSLLQKYPLLYKIPITLIFPLLGLAVNSGHLMMRYTGGEFGFFGNFSNKWFYILAIVNGLALCLPNLPNRWYRLVLFLWRSCTFAYTLYFFLAFLPYMFLAVPMIVMAGIGFLILTPCILFLLHVNIMSKDIQFLKTQLSPGLLAIGAMVFFLLIPAAVTRSYLDDRTSLHQALDYIYHPDYDSESTVDQDSVEGLLKVLRVHKRRDRGFSPGKQVPFLSSYYTWLVLDNLTISDKKLDLMQQVYEGQNSVRLREGIAPIKTAEIQSISSSSTYDRQQDAWTSWIDLELHQDNDRLRAGEYLCHFNLPNGCWVSDYYLYVEDRKEMGLLTEKKAAEWVYSQIRSRNRDPGLLTYISGNTLSFRVFPFVRKQTRKTGIQLIHKEPFQLDFDGRKIMLGDPSEQAQVKSASSSDGEVIYVSKAEKQTLKEVYRQPYMHFLVDVSLDMALNKDRQIARLQSLLDSKELPLQGAKISFVNTYGKTTEFGESWTQDLRQQACEGGFYLRRAMDQVLVQSYKEMSDRYPVMLVLTDSLHEAILPGDFRDLAMSYPESPYFYAWTDEGLTQHSLNKAPKQIIARPQELQLSHPVFAWPGAGERMAYLDTLSQPSIVLNSDIISPPQQNIAAKDWQAGLSIWGAYLSQVLHPDREEHSWLQMVRASFKSRIMNPYTAYMVVENEAQKLALLRKQEQILSGKQSLDAGEELRPMSEPGIGTMLLLLTMMLFVARKLAKIRSKGQSFVD